MPTTQIKITRIKAITRQRTATGRQWVAHVETDIGAASLQSPSMSRLRRRLIDRGCTDGQIFAATK